MLERSKCAHSLQARGLAPCQPCSRSTRGCDQPQGAPAAVSASVEWSFHPPTETSDSHGVFASARRVSSLRFRGAGIWRNAMRSPSLKLIFKASHFTSLPAQLAHSERVLPLPSVTACYCLLPHLTARSELQFMLHEMFVIPESKCGPTRRHASALTAWTHRSHGTLIALCKLLQAARYVQRHEAARATFGRPDSAQV